MPDNNKNKKTNIENNSAPKVFSLQNIIASVLNDDSNITVTNSDSFESNVKRLSRRFTTLIKIMGGDTDMLKSGKKYSFAEDEVPFMKVIISQLHRGEGIIADIIDKHKTDKVFSAKEVHGFIQEIIGEADKAGADEETLKKMAEFLQTIFLVSPYHYRERCHILIDTLAANMADMISSVQTSYWQRISDLLAEEVNQRIKESISNILDIAVILNTADDSDADKPVYDPNVLSEECIMEYSMRDKNVLEAIKRNADLRTQIEEETGRKAEEIFSHVDCENKS